MKNNKEHNYQIGSKKLRINENSISWTNKLLDNIIYNPTEIRYGTAPIEIDMFTIGTKYKIDLRNDNGNTFSISIKSYFGIGRNKKFELYQEITDVIWEYFFEERFALIASEWEKGKTQQIGKYEISSTELIRRADWKGTEIAIHFDEMQLMPRFDHLLINSKDNTNKYLRIIYLEDWNWPVIHEILYRAKEKCSTSRI